jgi:hypothetical protein
MINTVTTTRKPGVTITNLVSNTLPAAKADTQRVCQILLNILGNALKFTEQGDVQVSAERLQDTNMLSVAVRDTGIGIAQEDMTKVFMPFTQGNVLCDLHVNVGKQNVSRTCLQNAATPSSYVCVYVYIYIYIYIYMYMYTYIQLLCVYVLCRGVLCMI